mmetsp:Transcript_34506/g.75499  ORF Transcript_34506/g.75499 Transcript_34506/m.75499 type:complete len:317 (+) Transcript_34506:32-982(+)
MTRHASMAALGALAAIGVAIYLLRPTKKTPFLNRQRQALKIVKRTMISSDTIRLRLGLPRGKSFGLPIGKHIKVFGPNIPGKTAGQWNGAEDKEASAKEIERKYTPCAVNDEQGYVDLVVKAYLPGTVKLPDGSSREFADGGKLSRHLFQLKEGQSVELSGPWGTNEYQGQGKFKTAGKLHQASKISMMAGGSGITPMLQVAQAILADPRDKTQVALLYANKTETDILCQEELEALATAHPSRFSVSYTLDAPPADWGARDPTRHFKGFINKDMVHAALHAPTALALMCGPPPMIKFACRPSLQQVGYDEGKVVEF